MSSPKLWGLSCTVTLSLLLGCLVLFGCAGLRPSVTLENPSTERLSVDLRTLPPSCPEMPLPEYPESLVEQELPPISVRVDFTITKKGAVRGAAASASESGDSTPLFERVAQETVSAWRCQPATQLYQEEKGAPAVFKSVDYKTWVVIRFEVEEGRAKASVTGR